MRAACPVNERYIGNAYVFREEEKCRLLKRNGLGDPAELLREDYHAAGFLSEPEQMQFVDLKHWLPGDILQKADKMSMAHSLELRVPFLDRDVFEVARRIPREMKVRRRTTKYILREAALDSLPKSVSSKTVYPHKNKKPSDQGFLQSARQDLNLRPRRPERRALPS